MAPEQATSRSRIGPETDVWALGLMAFHLLTGRHYWYAFNHDAQPTPMEVGVEVLTAPLESASARAVSLGVGGLLPPGFDAWFARCVARDRGARFRDATECITALREALVGRAAQPPTARTTPAAPRLPGPMPMQTGAGFASFEVPVSFVAPGPVAPHNVRSQPTPSTRHDPWAGAATSGRTEAPTHSSGKSTDGARDVSKQHSRFSIATMTMTTALALSASGYWGWSRMQAGRSSNGSQGSLATSASTGNSSNSEVRGTPPTPYPQPDLPYRPPPARRAVDYHPVVPQNQAPPSPFAGYSDVRCTATPRDSFHLRASPTTARSGGVGYPGNSTVGLVRAERLVRNGARMFFVRVGSGASGYIFLLPGELDSTCPPDIVTRVNQAPCITTCARDYSRGMAQCEDGCGPYEEMYSRCLQQCGTSMDEIGLPEQ
jgi:hypothetical protein